MAWNARTDFDKYYRINAERMGVFWDGVSPRRKAIHTHYNYYGIGEVQRDTYALLLKTAANLIGPTVIVGAGFGWTCEGLINAGLTACIGTDISSYIDSAKTQSEEADIRDYITAVGLDPDTSQILCRPTDVGATWNNDWKGWVTNPLSVLNKRIGPRTLTTIAAEDLSTGQSRSAVRNALGGKVSHFVTEELLNSISDADALLVCQAIESARTSNIAANGCTVHHMLSPLQPGFQQAPELNWKLYENWRAFLDSNGFSFHKIVCTVQSGGRNLYEVM